MTEPGTATRRGRTPAPILFVGGTGRSGTHVVANLIARNRNLALVPVEVRFHVDERGFPGLLSGEVTPQQFLKRMRGFWWKGFQTNRFRGLYKIIEREPFEAALRAFEPRFEADPADACRRLFIDLLWPRVEAKPGAVGMVEQSCDTIAQGALLSRLFPEARFVHVVRDGRDSSASRVGQTHGLVEPRTRRQGIAWWERRTRAIDDGARAIPDHRLHQVGLHELYLKGRRPAMRRLARFAGVVQGKRMKRFLLESMSPRTANAGRWRQGLSDSKRAELDRLYSEALDRLEADGVLCVPLLREAYRRSEDEASLPAGGRAGAELTA